MTRNKNILQAITLVLVLFVAPAAFAATWYVDSSVSTSGNGQSWDTAWKSFSNITGLSSGDTVYISGGPSGQSQTYTMSSWSPTSGVTYKIGQDSSHNGTAFLSGSGTWISGGSGWTVSGDAGDGKRHITIANPSTNVSPWSRALGMSSCSGFTLDYVNFGMISGSGSPNRVISCNNSTNIEISNTWTYVTSSQNDAWGYVNCNVRSYDSCRILNNVIDVPTSGAIGADGLQACNSGCTFAGNTVQTHRGGGVNHQDLFQSYAGGASCSYTKLYNNTFKNSGQYSIYQDCDGAQHWRIYNNIFINSSVYSVVFTGEWGGEVYSDIIIANNLHADGGGIFANGATSSYSDTYIRNDVRVNNNGYNVKGSIVRSNNVSISAAEASTYFVDYPNEDFHLKQTATSLIDQGYDMSSYFITDKDSTNRGSAWTIGPYEFKTLITNVPSSPSNLQIN